jgi:hypothetical protein
MRYVTAASRFNDRARRQHLLGSIDADHVRRAHLSHPAGERAESATEVEHTQSFERRQHRAQGRPLRRTGKTVARARQLAVTLEELGVIVQVARHLRRTNDCINAWRVQFLQRLAGLAG